ncbi:MAG: hypothetical protein K2N34_14985 [Lachnospiraceae bacterium]|nr:hypothetical protein [Lachnospiraceae bacterium]
MKIELDIQLNRKLRGKVNEINNFSVDKTAEFQFPSDKKGNRQESNAFNCICAALDRIDDLVEHCNTLDLTQSQEGTFALCDLFNYGQTLIDCITKIGEVYGAKYSPSNDISSFHQQGATGKGNDEKYFKYLRSLCSVHPLETSAHKEYQGDQPEWCPYIDIGESVASRLLSCHDGTLSKADFIARIYRNDMEFSKYIPIYVKQIFHYIKKRYKFINEIISAIDEYNNKQIETLKRTHILLPSECATYDEYLKNLENEIHIRCGRWEYQAKTWRAIFKTHYDDKLNETALSAYKEELKKGITKIHAKLQAMDFLDEDFACDAIEDRRVEQLKEYHYEMEKMGYLFPSYALEDREIEDFSFIDKTFALDYLRMKEMLDAMDKALKTGMSHKDLELCSRYLDDQYKVTNSEWARIQLKIMSLVLGKYISFDYFSNDWRLYLQVEIAKWLLLRNEEIH